MNKLLRNNGLSLVYMNKLLRNNGLSLVLLSLFVLLLAGQALSGYLENNDDRKEHNQPPIPFPEYLSSPHFLEATFENWESEFLQMAAYVIFTVFLFQKGSAESKDPNEEEPVDDDPRRHANEPGVPGPVRRGGWKLKLYEHSLSLAFFALFLVSWLGHAMAGVANHNEELKDHGEPAMSLLEYVGSSRFWFESFQNWQSEFLAVAAIVILSIWLRERGSPESKPVACRHDQTGE
jgi:hypothetical protein